MKLIAPRIIVNFVTSSMHDTTYLVMQKNRMVEAFNHAQTNLQIRVNYTEDLLGELQEEIQEHMDIRIKLKHILRMLVLFPVSASVIVGDMQSTAMREELLNMVSMYYLGSYWPGPEDEVDVDTWTAIIASAIDYFNEPDTNEY